MELILVFALGAYVGSRVNAWLNLLAMREMLKDLGIKDSDLTALLKKQNQKLGIEDPEEEELPTIEVKLEQHQGQIYAFRKDNDEFLGQGTSREDLIDHISKRMKNVKLNISRDDGADLLQKNNT
jgi:hypothetical protein